MMLPDIKVFKAKTPDVQAVQFRTNNEGAGGIHMDSIVSWMNRGQETMVAWHNGTNIFIRDPDTHEETKVEVTDWIVLEDGCREFSAYKHDRFVFYYEPREEWEERITRACETTVDCSSTQVISTLAAGDRLSPEPATSQVTSFDTVHEEVKEEPGPDPVEVIYQDCYVRVIHKDGLAIAQKFCRTNDNGEDIWKDKHIDKQWVFDAVYKFGIEEGKKLREFPRWIRTKFTNDKWEIRDLGRVHLNDKYQTTYGPVYLEDIVAFGSTREEVEG